MKHPLRRQLQFFLREADIGKPRAAVTAPRLAELNSYVPIKILEGSGEITPDMVTPYQVSAGCTICKSSTDESLGGHIDQHDGDEAGGDQRVLPKQGDLLYCCRRARPLRVSGLYLCTDVNADNEQIGIQRLWKRLCLCGLDGREPANRNDRSRGGGASPSIVEMHWLIIFTGRGCNGDVLGGDSTWTGRRRFRHLLRGQGDGGIEWL